MSRPHQRAFQAMEPRDRWNPAEPFVTNFVSHARETLKENLLSVALFGSAARGTLGPNSDVDLLVIVRDLPREPFAHAWLATRLTDPFQSEAYAAWKRTGWMPYLSVIVRTAQEAKRPARIYFDMTLEARILFDRDGLLAEILGRTRDRLRQLGARRVWLDSSWYWDLKPDFKPGDVIEL